ncbi:MAG: glycosyltransferase family 4 protein [Euryarchaeota archaeon]|nr:glycosyltransferase family 4 protein [Euryarchaeota archaeon]
MEKLIRIVKDYGDPVVITNPTMYPFSGIDRVAYEQAKKLLSLGFDVKIVTFENLFNAQDVKISEIRLFSGGLLSFKPILKIIAPFIPRVVREFERETRHAKVIIAHHYPMTALASVLKSKRRKDIVYVYYNHGNAPTKCFYTISEKLYQQILILLTKMTTLKADYVFSVSKYLAMEYEKLTGKKSDVIYNEVDERFKKAKAYNGSIIRRKLGISEDDVVLLYVGRIVPYKGVHELIEAYKIVKDKGHENVKLLIVGKEYFEWYSKKLKKIADNGVIFYGVARDEDMPYIFAASDIYVTASHWEGYDLPAAEAQTMGKPVVAYAIGAHPEVVKYGSLVREGDIKAFAEEIVRWIEIIKRKKRN